MKYAGTLRRIKAGEVPEWWDVHGALQNVVAIHKGLATYRRRWWLFGPRVLLLTRSGRQYLRNVGRAGA